MMNTNTSFYKRLRLPDDKIISLILMFIFYQRDWHFKFRISKFYTTKYYLDTFSSSSEELFPHRSFYNNSPLRFLTITSFLQEIKHSACIKFTHILNQLFLLLFISGETAEVYESQTIRQNHPQYGKYVTSFQNSFNCQLLSIFHNLCVHGFI